MSKKSNHQLIDAILYSDLKRDQTAIQMARDLQVMTRSDCCMKDRISCWENIYLDKVNDFQNHCAEDFPDDRGDLLDRWYDMVVEDQIGLILGDYDCPPIETCTCKCATHEENE